MRYLFAILINFDYRTQQFDTVHDPMKEVLKVKTGVGNFATQEGSPYTTGDAVALGFVVKRYLAVSWLWFWVIADYPAY